MQILCYEKCGTCKKALKWLKDNGIAVPVRPIKEENPSKEELREWQKRSGLPLHKFFNTSGKLYREYELSKKLPGMSEEEMLDLLASDGMLVKRPLLIGKDKVLVGFRENEYAETLL
ncbi:MAG: arsenate reductase family protein [Erysipelotrichaceae bacterium]|nr:arsenate reductase family protein [Erysipelotrichaceae bacterium]